MNDEDPQQPTPDAPAPDTGEPLPWLVATAPAISERRSRGRAVWMVPALGVALAAGAIFIVIKSPSPSPPPSQQAALPPAEEQDSKFAADAPRTAPSEVRPAPVIVDTPKPVAREAPAPAPKAPAREKTPEVRRAPEVPGTTVQLGAFSNRNAAERAWRSMDGKAAFRSAQHKVVAARVGGRTYYRLRATLPAAPAACRKLGLAIRNCYTPR
jgi:hypothetical protein